MWQGKHPQAPVAVAAKPHYFSELNIKQTVRNLLKHHPQFFASEQMTDSVRSGDILTLDPSFFSQVLMHWHGCMLSASHPLRDSLPKSAFDSISIQPWPACSQHAHSHKQLSMDHANFQVITPLVRQAPDCSPAGLPHMHRSRCVAAAG